jgi:hypothetical protein
VILKVYVPREGSFAAQVIAPGSAIVGSPSDSGDTVRIDFEGNVFGAANGSFRDCLARAAGRHVEKYPTRARLYVNDDEEVIAVGTYDTETRELRLERPGLLEDYRASKGGERG